MPISEAEQTAAGKEELRSGIESEFNGLRDEIERNFSTAKYNLEQQYFEDIKANRLAKEAAMRAAGLNSDGSSPYGRPSDAD
jgi:hypothetical protein